MDIWSAIQKTSEFQRRVLALTGLRGGSHAPFAADLEYRHSFNYVDRFDRFLRMAIWPWRIQGWRAKYLHAIISCALINAWVLWHDARAAGAAPGAPMPTRSLKTDFRAFLAELTTDLAGNLPNTPTGRNTRRA